MTTTRSRARRATRHTTAVPVTTATPEPRRLCTVQRAAEISGESAWTWRARAYKGVVASVKIGGPQSRLLIPESEVLRLIEAGTRPAVSA